MTDTAPKLTSRKAANHAFAEKVASERRKWRRRNAYFYEEDERYMRFLVPEGQRVLDLGCGIGVLLASLKPSVGVGVDFSEGMLTQARDAFPDLKFHLGDVESLDRISSLKGKFDTIILSDTIGALDDCLDTLKQLPRFCHPKSRVIISYYAPHWSPLFRLGAMLGLKQPNRPQNWLNTQDIANLLDLAGFDIVRKEWRILSPRRMFGIGRLINRFIGTLPLIRKLGLRNYLVARPRPKRPVRNLSATVLVPCRNERGNIEAAVTRLPEFCEKLEIMFVEGGSSDGTWEEIQRVISAHPDKTITAYKQPGKGKGDAVRKGFDEAQGDVLMILDADLTVPPEDMPKFYDALADGQGEFINGSRLVYPMEREAMRFLNLLANHTFSRLFTYLLNQRYTDTLCGTKVLLKTDYERIAANRAYFGEFDPFGDFDLIFGASKLNLKTVEIPIRYQSRSYGETQISRFRHGWLLLRMVVFAFKKLKAL